MNTFAVTVTTPDGAKQHYTAIGSHSFDVWDAAVSTFGPWCKVFVIRK